MSAPTTTTMNLLRQRETQYKKFSNVTLDEAEEIEKILIVLIFIVACSLKTVPRRVHRFFVNYNCFAVVKKIVRNKYPRKLFHV